MILVFKILTPHKYSRNALGILLENLLDILNFNNSHWMKINCVQHYVMQMTISESIKMKHLHRAVEFYGCTLTHTTFNTKYPALLKTKIHNTTLDKVFQRRRKYFCERLKQLPYFHLIERNILHFLIAFLAI